MKGINKLIFPLIMISLCAAFSEGHRGDDRPWPADFGAKAKPHIEALAALGPHCVGTPNEGRAGAYVAAQFQAMGLPALIEPFDFESYEIASVDLMVGGEKIVPVGIGLDPYGAEPEYSGPFVVLDRGHPSDWPTAADIAGKAVVTCEAGDPALFFRISALRPRCIIDLAAGGLERVRGLADRRLTLSVRGGLEKGTSRNVVSRLGPAPPAPQIIIGAHMDGFRDAPGANDNASGVAVVLELARYLKSLDGHGGIGLTFVVFGGEESGVLGSRQYVERHAGELKSCRLALALDNLGGDGPVQVEREGGLPEPPPIPGSARIPQAYRGRAWTGRGYPWSLVPPQALLEAFGAPCHPAWLKAGIEEAVKGLGFDVQFTGLLGSDQMSFAQAGIVTTGIGAANGRAHTQNDRPETVNLEKVSRCAETAARIIQRIRQHLGPPEGPLGRASGLLSEEDLRRAKPMADVRFLASDELRGRRAGSPEENIAARYIAERLRAAGVETLPEAPDYFQNVVWEGKDALAVPPGGSSRAPMQARNVVGVIRGRDAERNGEFVLIMAHYDHLGAKTIDGAERVFNGARDNAMGVAALLAASETLALRPPARSVVILATTFEEEGMIGSRFFVKHPLVPLSRILFVLNNDGAGAYEPGLWCIGGLERTDAGPLVDAAGLAHGLETRPYPEKFRFLYAKGDAISFANRGIPALTVSPGFTEDQVERISKIVHTPADRVDSDFDKAYLRRFCLAYADLSRAVADAKTVPSWAAEGEPPLKDGH